MTIAVWAVCGAWVAWCVHRAVRDIRRAKARAERDTAAAKSRAVNRLVRAGFTHDSALTAVKADDISVLRHTGWLP